MPGSHPIQVQHYSLKHRAIAWVSKNLFDWPVYTVRSGLLAGMRRKGGLAWLPVSPAQTEEQRFWRAQDFEGKVVYDIGAFHGLLTLYFARSAKQVVSYEPDAINRARLMKNVSLNRLENVLTRPVALGENSGRAELHHDELMPGGSRITLSSGAGGVSVETLDAEVYSGLPAPDFIKVDVEGFEVPVLRGARRVLEQYKPPIFVEIHGDTDAEKSENAGGVIDALRAAGYTSITHVESARPATEENARRGHIFAR